MLFVRLSCILFIFLFLASCDSNVERTRALGEAYAGPTQVNVRQDISLRSPTVATASHGEELDVLEVRRRWARVRTYRGVEGWVDTRMLLSVAQMNELKSLAARAAAMPTQGTAVALEPLNMHTDPNRLSATFFQIPEKGKLEVLDRKVTPRKQPTPDSISFPRPQRPRRGSKKPKAEPLIPPPPPPPPPSDWIALSQPKIVPVDAAAKDNSTPGAVVAKDAPAMDDWSLVRTADHHAGWVLSRMYNMAIPDEVAQYAEGHRITSYFSLGQIADDEQGVKNHWLWTTMEGVKADRDFDSFRVFIWNRRRHRYETAYIEKHIYGHYPVEANLGGKTGTFTLITEDESGKWMKRSFVLEGYQVRKLGQEAYQPPAPAAAGTAQTASAQTPKNAPGIFALVRQRIARWFGQ